MHLNLLEIILLSIFILCLIVGFIGTRIYKRIQKNSEDDALADTKLLKQENMSDKEISDALDDMAENMFSDESYKDKNDDYIEY